MATTPRCVCCLADAVCGPADPDAESAYAMPNAGSNTRATSISDLLLSMGSDKASRPLVSLRMPSRGFITPT